MNERFSRIIGLIGEEKLARIQKTTVMVIGLGGVGGYAAEALARSGIGTLIVVDNDAVEASNLNRQIISTVNNIGQRKTEALKERAAAVNPDITVVAHDLFVNEQTIPQIFSQPVDYVVDAIDTLTSKVQIWKYCQKNGIKVISCMGTAKRIDPTKLKITTLKKTENDPMAKALRQIARKNEVSLDVPVVFSDEQPLNRSQELLGSLMFVPASAGILCADYVIRQICEI